MKKKKKPVRRLISLRKPKRKAPASAVITTRKAVEAKAIASESRLRLVLEAINEYGIFLLNPQGKFIMWNAGAKKILGYTEAEVRGRDLSLIFADEGKSAEPMEKILARASAEGSTRIERWHVRKDGTKFWDSGVLSVLTGSNGQRYGFVKVVRDNTDAKLAEDQLREAMSKAESANASKDHFLANVSHELRTPLSAMLLWSKLLLDQKESDPAFLQEGLEAINRSAHEQHALIEDLMDTAKIVAGKMRLDPKKIDLNELLRTCLPPIRSAATEHQLAIDEALSEDLGTIHADPRRLQQVVSNLLNNAIKFTPAGGRITLRTIRVGQEVRISVTDTGQGISHKFINRIFDRFVRADQGSTPTARGMGLGLAVARQLVELHGGTIRAESSGEGRGSTFTILLPAERVPL